MASSLLFICTITSILLKVTASDNEGIKPVCIRELSWVPGYRRKVILNLLNDINYPSWISKFRNHLTLPKGTPYAFACGACYTPWKTPSLSFRAIGTQALFNRVLSCNKRLEHRVNSHTYCVISYGLTSPLESGRGSLECQLNRNEKITKEKVTFSTVEVETESFAVEEIYANYKGYVQVSCPDVPVEDIKNFVYVWHLPNGQKGIVTHSLRKVVILKGREKPYEIVCSTYDTYNPRKVWKKSYIIYGQSEEWNNSEGIANLGRDYEGHPRMSLANITIIAAAILVLLLLTSVLIAVFRETRLSKRRLANMRDTKQLTEIER